MLRIHFLLVILFSCFMISSCLSANKVKSPHCPSLTIGEQITDLKIEPFIPYAVVLPHSAFYGSDYTVSLKLLSEHSPPKCWFTFDSYTLLVTFLADHDVINAKPRDGYLFEIEAKSRCDETKVRQQFRISIFDSTYITCMTLQIEIARTITKSRDHVDACAMDVLDDVLSRTQDYMSHESAGHSLSCLLQDYEIQDGRQVRFTMGYLVKHESECRHLCAKNFFEPYVARLVDRFGSINPRFDDLLAPVYTTSSAVADVRCNMFTTDSPLTTSVARTSTRPPPICTPPSISSQMDNVIIRNANRPHAIAIPQNLFKDQHTLSLSLYLPSDSLTICWFRFTSSSVHFFPTTTTVAKQPKDGYKFSLTATNSCGLSSTVQFNVKINQDVSPSCFYYQTEVVHSMNLCEETILKEFYHVLQNQMQQSVRISDIVSKTPMRSVINFTLISPTQDCSHCNIAFLDNLARRLNLQNLIRIFAHSNVLTKIVNPRFVITSPACKKTCKGVQKEISFNANSGRIKEFTLPDNLRHVSLFDSQDPHICLLQDAEDSSKTKLLFLPPKPIHPYYAIHKYEYSLVEASSSCSIKLNMHTSRSKLVTCHEIRMKFKTIEDFSCSLDAVRNMVTLLIDYYRVQTSQIIIQSYQILENNEIELVFSFDKDVIDCSACSLTLLKTYIGQLINSKGEVTTHFGNLIKNRFILNNVTYLFNAHEQEHLSRFHESDDSNPIWLYMIPAWIILFLLLLLLLLCCLCCCCCGGGKKNIMSCLSSCCACCFGGRTKQRKIRRFNTAGDPSIRQISTNSIDLEKTMLSSTNHMKTHTAVQNLSSNNSSSNVGLNTNNQTVTYAVANKQKSSTHLNATPSLSNQSNKSNDIKLTSANMTSSKTAESCASNQKSSSIKTRNLSTKSTRKHVRSLSDGCLIEDDYLALPTPPVARKTSDVTRKSSHRASYRYRENADVSTSGRITIPIKITARVKNISKSLDDGLNREPVSRVKFTDKSETDDDPIISKYRSHERTILRTTPILSRRVLLDGEDRRSAFRTKSIDKETVTKRYPWQQDAETFRKQRTKTRKWSEPYLSDNSMTFFSDSNNVRLKKYSRNDQFL